MVVSIIKNVISGAVMPAEAGIRDKLDLGFQIKYFPDKLRRDDAAGLCQHV